MSLRLDWCDYKAAKYAVEHWHYSGIMPAGKLVTLGVWESERYIGVIIFGRSARLAHRAFRVSNLCIAELARVALTTHQTAVSKIIKVSLKLLKRHCPELRLIISFADQNQEHLGTIYQASNWIYTGVSKTGPLYNDDNGKTYHTRNVSASGRKKQFGVYKDVKKIADLIRVNSSGKHKYLYPLDEEMRKQIEPLRKPYPKRASVVEKHNTTLPSVEVAV